MNRLLKIGFSYVGPWKLADGKEDMISNEKIGASNGVQKKS